eukprot:3175044-Pleurochrysis_carterae.AAC.1
MCEWQTGERACALWHARARCVQADESKMAPAATAFEEEFLSVMGSPAANVCYGRSGLLHLGFRALDE